MFHEGLENIPFLNPSGKKKNLQCASIFLKLFSDKASLSKEPHTSGCC